MYIVTMMARRKGAKRHIFGRYKTRSEATTAAMLPNKRYIVTIVSGNWQPVAARATDDNGNMYINWVVAEFD